MRHSRRNSSVAALLTFATLATLSTACARTAPVGTIGAQVRTEDGVRMAAARAETEQQLAQIQPGPVGRTEAGMTAEAFNTADQNDDGQLSRTEQLTHLRLIWSAMGRLADLKAPVVEAQASDGPVQTGDYKVAHDVNYAPGTAEAFIDAAEIMPAVYQTLQSAQRTIRMDLFLFGGKEGQKLAELLVQKYQQGVDVRIIHDPSYGMAGETKAQIIPVIRYLQGQGIMVKNYPLRYLPRRNGHPLANKFQIDHNKIIVVDSEVAMVGTMNLIDIGVMNHDIYMRLSGSAARELAAIHDATWQLKGATTPDYRRAEPPKPSIASRTLLGLDLASADAAESRVVKTDIDHQDVKSTLLDAIKGAKKSVHVGIFEFGDTEVARALIDAYKRGVDVKVLADTNANYGKYLEAFKSVKLYGTPNLVTTELLRDAGVPVKWFIAEVEGQELHMKMALIDQERVIVGSTNFTYQAFNTFRETSMDIRGAGAVGRLETMFQKDWETRGRPVQKPNFHEKVIMAAVRAMDKFNLSWW